jgi:hypothetical protein
MNAHLKSSLVKHMQKWLDSNADAIGGSMDIWQDTSQSQRNAHLMATAAELALDAMNLQSELELESARLKAERNK